MAVLLEARKAFAVVPQHKTVRLLRDEVGLDSLVARMAVVDMVDLMRLVKNHNKVALVNYRAVVQVACRIFGDLVEVGRLEGDILRHSPDDHTGTRVVVESLKHLIDARSLGRT